MSLIVIKINSFIYEKAEWDFLNKNTTEPIKQYSIIFTRILDGRLTSDFVRVKFVLWTEFARVFKFHKKIRIIGSV